MKMLTPFPSRRQPHGLLHGFVHVGHCTEAVLLQDLHRNLFVGSS